MLFITPNLAELGINPYLDQLLNRICKSTAIRSSLDWKCITHSLSYPGAPFGFVLENLVYFRLVNYTKNMSKMAKNGQKSPKWTFFEVFVKISDLKGLI